MTNSYAPQMTVIKKINRETTDTNTYILEFVDNHAQKTFSSMPGQFMMISVFGAGDSAISLSSTPNNNGSIGLTIREVGNVTNAIFKLKMGDFIGVRGPYGKGWPLHDISEKDVLLVAGGMGLAPLKGVITYLKQKKKDFNHLEILYGARSPEDMIFRGEYSTWKKMKNTRVTLTVDEVPPGEKWEGHVGLVTALFPQMVTRPTNAIVFACGPEIMMLYVVKSLETIGFKRDQIYVSLERRMRCGIGKCGHYQIGSKYVCKDGPVFRCSELKNLPDIMI